MTPQSIIRPQSLIRMVTRFTSKYGVIVSWQELATEKNSRGKTRNTKTETVKTARVLLLKEKFNTLKPIDTGIFGLSQDYTRYVLSLPDVDLQKDMVITDNRGMKWKLGIVDWFDVAGIPVAKQASLTEVQ